MRNLTKAFLFLTILMTFSCAKEPIEQNHVTTCGITIASYPAFGDQTKDAGTPDAGKTKWESGDKIYIIFQTSGNDLALRYRMSYDGSAWGDLQKYEGGVYTAAESIDMSQQPYRAKFYYAPSYEFASGEAFKLAKGKKAGVDEYLTWTSGDSYDITDGSTLVVSFGRKYSRLRVNAPGGQVVELSSAAFVPAGFSTSALGTSTLDSPVNASDNAFFYGSWDDNTNITVRSYNSSNNLEGEKSFANRPKSTDAKSYAMKCIGYGDGYTTLADLAATATSSSKAFDAKIKATVTYVKGNYVHLEDKTGAILLYQDGTGLVAGNTVDGNLSGKISLYNNLPEIQNATLTSLAIGTTAKIPCTELTLASLLANYTRYMSCRVLLKGITIETGIYGSTSATRTGEISQGGSSINIYATYTPSPAVLDAGLDGNLIAYPSVYKSDKQLSVYEASQFTETGGEKEESAFTALTVFGKYSATDTEDPQEAYEYAEGIDQLVSKTSSSETVFAITNPNTGSLAMLTINGKPVVGNEYSAEANFGGSVTNHTLKVVGREGKKYWLEDKTQHIGYIINIE